MIQGPARSVRVLTADELKQNGGRWELRGGPAIPVIGLDDNLNRDLIDGPKLVVYPVTDAEIDSGFELMAGPELPMYSLLENRDIIDGPAIPVRVISGELGVQPLLLDNIDADFAISTRKLRTAYAGSALRLRRNSDNAESDIGFVGEDLDTAAVVSFLGGASGLFTTWYDQSGNISDVSQSTASKQSLYVATGINSKPVTRFDGTNDLLTGSNFLSSSEGMVFAVYQLTAALQDTQDILTSDDEATAFVHRMVCRGFRTAAQPNLSVIQRNNDAQDRVRGSTALVAATPYLNMWSSNGTGYVFRVNGVTQANTVVQGADNGDWFGDTDNRDNVSIGAEKASVEATWLKGDMAEIVVLSTFSTSDRDAIESNQAPYWGIALP